MKTYLNREEKTDIVKLSALIGSLSYFEEAWSKRNNLNPEEKGELRKAIVVLDRVMDMIMRRFSDDTLKQVYREAQNTELLCVSKPRAEIIEKDIEVSAKLATVNRKALDMLAFKALHFCNPCEEENQDKCELRKIFQELDIDPYDCETTGCQYCIRKKRIRKRRDKSE